MEVCSEDQNSEQDISSEESEDELDKNEEHFIFGKDKESKWRKNPVRKQIRKQPQNILCQLPLVWPKAKNAQTELDTWNGFITNATSDLISLSTNKYIDSILSWFSGERDAT